VADLTKMCPRRGWALRTASPGVGCCLAVALLSGGLASAQSVESDVTSESEHLVKDASHYAIPDVSDKSLDTMKVEDEHDRFQIKFGLALLAGDYTSFKQDAESKAQVGNQRD